MMTRAHTAWHRLLDATHLPIAGYLVFAGIYSRVVEGGVVMGQLPPWFSTVWSFSLVLGGALIFWGTLSGQTRTESSGHGFHLFGITLYTVSYTALLGWEGVVVVATLSLVSLIRMRILHRARVAQREAARVAARMAGGSEDP